MGGGTRGHAIARVRRAAVGGIVGGVLVAAGAAILILALSASSFIRQEIERRGRSDLRALAANLAGPLSGGYARSAAALVASVGEQMDVVEVIVADTGGRVFAASREALVDSDAPAYHRGVSASTQVTLYGAGSPEAGPDAILLLRPVLGDPDSATGVRPLLGSVSLRVSHGRAAAALWQSVGIATAATLAVAGLIGFAVYLLLLRQGLRPMEQLIQGVQQMADGNLDARIDSGGLGAFADVGDALNEMWLGLASLATRVGGITGRVRGVTERLSSSMEEIDTGSQTQAEAVEETAGMLARVNESIRRVHGEIETLSSSTEEASSSILEMGSSVEEVARSVTSLNDAVESASSSSQEMGASIRQVAESADEVQRMAEETAASMTEMDRAIQEVGEHVKQASALAQKVSEGAEEGQQAVDATIEGIQEIRIQTGDAKDVLERLDTRIGEIGAILNVIGDINDETNLLSLNAAIIAAQAGEQGKAFAVVANHVKTLAQRTAMSTQEIERLIHAIQDESANATKAMAKGMSSVETGVERSRRAGEALSTIRAQAADANARVSEISRAAEEQGRNSKHVADAANRTSTMVQKISAAMAEQSRASEQMLATSESALSVCRQVQRSADEQRQSGAFITQSIAQVGEMMRSIQQNITDHGRASESVSEAVHRVLDVARKTSERVPEIVGIVEELRADAEALESEVGRFRGGEAAQEGSGSMESASSATQTPA